MQQNSEPSKYIKYVEIDKTIHVENYWKSTAKERLTLCLKEVSFGIPPIDVLDGNDSQTCDICIGKKGQHSIIVENTNLYKADPNRPPLDPPPIPWEQHAPWKREKEAREKKAKEEQEEDED